MICLAVSSNGKHLCFAGDPDGLVMAGLLSGTHLGTPPRPGFGLTVTGAVAEGNVEWTSRDLFVGDEVLIKIVESAAVDSPTRIVTEAEFEDLVDKRGLLLARGTYAALKARMRLLEQEYGDRLLSEQDA